MLSAAFMFTELCNATHNRLFTSLQKFSSTNKNFVMFPGKDLKHLKNRKEVLEHTITEEDLDTFSKVTGDFNVIHKKSNGNRAIVHGALLNGIVSGVIGTKLPGNGTIVLSQELQFPNPCFAGDTIVVTVEIKDVRKIISCNYNIVKKVDKSVVLKGNARLILKQ